ncbi:PIN domain-containing protein [Candidatus Pacearchaeota archaeon]|nr:PIN domain-containing protein [Candidatus Pacearchaeota archaeon]
MFKKKYPSHSGKIKQKARRSLNRQMSRKVQTYVIDTSIAINRFVRRLIRKGLQGKIIIPNAVIAELENLANKGLEVGFHGLEEIAGLHKVKRFHNIKIYFEGLRPGEHHIRYAKSGEIDAMIREIAVKNHATLITADLVQAKSAQAYGIPVLFLKSRQQEKKKKKFLWFKKK